MKINRRWLIPLLLVLLAAGVGVYILVDPYDQAAILRTAKAKSLQYHFPANDYAVVIDYRRSLLSRRLYLVDLRQNRVVVRTRVSHAFLSGVLYATDFSNQVSSYKSCGGVFLTGGAYTGKYGYSMKVRGMERGVNDNAWDRWIVFHSPSKTKYPFWSEGCFITSKAMNALLISKMANGRMVYVITG